MDQGRHKTRSEKRIEKKVNYIKDLIDQVERISMRNERLSHEEKYRQLIKTRDSIHEYLRLRLSGSAFMLLCDQMAKEEHVAEEERVDEHLKTLNVDKVLVHKFN